ncbi:MAG TPA: hypothetical protein VFT46_09070 [Holophagaceae bacterium]|nr:hypothetical protein [Holophagaceae bacterium]
MAALLLLLTLGSGRPAWTGRLKRVAVVLGPAWSGVPVPARNGLKLLLEDLAETAGATVLEADPGRSPAPELTVLTLEGDFGNAGLRLRARLQEPARDLRDLTPVEADPRRQMESFLAVAGLRSPAAGSVLPSEPGDLLPLAGAYGTALLGGDEAAKAAEPGVEALAARDPGCATAALARAEAIHRDLLEDGQAPLNAQADCAQAFDAALALVPGFPRAARYAGRFYTDTGNQRQAMRILFESARRWPQAPALRSGLAYAARTTGLLPGALGALRAASDLEGRAPSGQALTENTYLYTGQWDRFDTSLGPGSPDRPDPLGDFYRGYLRLLEGRRPEALACFRQAALPAGVNVPFEQLAKAYVWALDGHRPEAVLTLRTLLQARKGLRVPDGEFSFKIAEAFGFAGDPEDAMDTAQLAFSQGFGCTDWYARTPFLSELHGLPRWRALIDHLQARQQLLEREFPPERFEGAP